MPSPRTRLPLPLDGIELFLGEEWVSVKSARIAAMKKRHPLRPSSPVSRENLVPGIVMSEQGIIVEALRPGMVGFSY
jgi:hypothetical protein